MTCTAGALKTGKISTGIFVSDNPPKNRIMKTIVATMYGLRSDALINHIRRVLSEKTRGRGLAPTIPRAIPNKNVRQETRAPVFPLNRDADRHWQNVRTSLHQSRSTPGARKRIMQLAVRPILMMVIAWKKRQPAPHR